MTRLQLLTTKHCHLCDAARHAMAEISQISGVSWQEVDVAEDNALAREYGDRLPVVLLDGAEHGYWTVDKARLLRDLGDVAAES